MKMKLINILLLVSVVGLSGYSQSDTKLLRSADDAYLSEQYDDAELLYRKARQAESSLQANFNLGNATFQQERYEEAVDHYTNAINKTKNDETSSDAYYNLGNAYFQFQKPEEAIEAYKQAIRKNPNNDEAKYNLAVLKEILKQQQQQEQQQQQQNQDGESGDENEQNQEQQENQEDGEQEQKDGEQSDEQQESGEEKQDSTQNQSGEGAAFDSTRLEKQTLDSLDAAKLLQIIQSEEQKVQEKLRKYNSNRKKPDKDW